MKNRSREQLTQLSFPVFQFCVDGLVWLDPLRAQTQELIVDQALITM